MLEVIFLRLRLWSFIILPVSGFFAGQLFQILLGTRHNPKFESLFIHIITAASMTILFADITVKSDIVVDIRDKILLLAISYLFVLGIVIGVISTIF